MLSPIFLGLKVHFINILFQDLIPLQWFCKLQNHFHFFVIYFNRSFKVIWIYYYLLQHDSAAAQGFVWIWLINLFILSPKIFLTAPRCTLTDGAGGVRKEGFSDLGTWSTLCIGPDDSKVVFVSSSTITPSFILQGMSWNIIQKSSKTSYTRWSVTLNQNFSLELFIRVTAWR